MVYFGPADDVKVEGKKGYGLNLISSYDKYEFSEHHNNYFYNDDKECAKEHGLDADKQYIVMFTKEVAPYIQEVPDKGFDPYKLLNETVVRSVIVSATWD